MGDVGNDFFNIKCAPNLGKTLLTYMLHAIMHIESLEESSILLISIFSVTITPVFDERDIRRGLGSGGRHVVMIPLL